MRIANYLLIDILSQSLNLNFFYKKTPVVKDIRILCRYLESLILVCQDWKNNVVPKINIPIIKCRNPTKDIPSMEYLLKIGANVRFYVDNIIDPDVTPRLAALKPYLYSVGFSSSVHKADKMALLLDGNALNTLNIYTKDTLLYDLMELISKRDVEDGGQLKNLEKLKVTPANLWNTSESEKNNFVKLIDDALFVSGCNLKQLTIGSLYFQIAVPGEGLKSFKYLETINFKTKITNEIVKNFLQYLPVLKTITISSLESVFSVDSFLDDVKFNKTIEYISTGFSSAPMTFKNLIEYLNCNQVVRSLDCTIDGLIMEVGDYNYPKIKNNTITTLIVTNYKDKVGTYTKLYDLWDGPSQITSSPKLTLDDNLVKYTKQGSGVLSNITNLMCCDIDANNYPHLVTILSQNSPILKTLILLTHKQYTLRGIPNFLAEIAQFKYLNILSLDYWEFSMVCQFLESNHPSITTLYVAVDPKGFDVKRLCNALLSNATVVYFIINVNEKESGDYNYNEDKQLNPPEPRESLSDYIDALTTIVANKNSVLQNLSINGPNFETPDLTATQYSLLDKSLSSNSSLFSLDIGDLDKTSNRIQ
ncbi:hypothetical protein DLAC_03197 [Tieghemostelium lacteum]|uniref:Uncharacterized protein n=1 Tax=Tieghemostelium lacteum TaxID=361077 RepID=A0A152A1H0_TIELA|nr:hypothetical protein DLAC_03197 [Tieghemostelium lacteum]|eukprot:KYR00054.1 hypothetical protein DLAC_03197 [Tieghemostelium lacteum]